MKSRETTTKINCILLLTLLSISVLSNPTSATSQASSPSIISKSNKQNSNKQKQSITLMTEQALSPINFTDLNQKLQTLNPKYLQQFSNTYTEKRIKNFINDQAGEYLFLLGKMYLYNILPTNIKGQNSQTQQQLRYQSNSKYILGYFYIKVSAQVYQIPDAYYYLAILEYMKITPVPLIKNNIKKIIKFMKSNQKSKSYVNHNMEKLMKQWQEQVLDKQEIIEALEDMAYDMESHHLHNTQHNLYLASLYGQVPAKLSLAYMLKDGISTDKNCSAAMGYYLSAIKNIKVDTFQFPSDYVDHKSLQKQLYSRKRLDLKGYGQYDPSVLMQTAMFDEETLSAYEDVAMKYMSGEDGFPINQTISVKMFQKMVHTSKISRIMLGFMYLKGRGVQKNHQKAREMFETEAKVSRVAKQTILAMKFYQLGYKGTRQKALTEIRDLYLDYERKTIRLENSTLQAMRAQAKAQAKDAKKTANKNEQQNQDDEEKSNSSAQKIKREKIDVFRTPMMKYIAGSLALSEQIKVSDKKYAIFLIDEAAKQGNTLALTQMGLIMLDGSDSSFDCERAANYFSKQSLSLVAFQQRIQLAKLGIKHEKYFFSFIKYVQLMMVGYKNAFVNALYLMEVYGDQMLELKKQSWSVAQAKKNIVYKFLVKENIIQNIDPIILDTFAPSGQNIFTQKNIQFLTQIEGQIRAQTESKSEKRQKKNKPAQLQQYINYMNLKITSIGIQKHQISILKFYKYKQAKDISVLHQLANTGQDSPHIYQSRFLLGQYYHHTNISGVNEEIRFRRAIEQYSRATKNRFLAQLIYVYEGGQFKQSQKIVSHLLWYLTVLIILGVGFYYKKNKKIQQILMLEQKKQQEQKNQRMRLQQQETNKNNKERENENISEIKRNQFLFSNKSEGNSKNEYKGPKFSEQEQQNMVRSRNFLNIGYLKDEKLKNINKITPSQQEKEKVENQNLQDKNQPIISNDQDQQASKPHYL